MGPTDRTKRWKSSGFKRLFCRSKGCPSPSKIEGIAVQQYSLGSGRGPTLVLQRFKGMAAYETPFLQEGFELFRARCVLNSDSSSRHGTFYRPEP